MQEQYAEFVYSKNHGATLGRCRGPSLLVGFACVLDVGWKSLMIVGDPSFGASPRTVNAMTTGIPGNSTGWAQLLLLDELNG